MGTEVIYRRYIGRDLMFKKLPASSAEVRNEWSYTSAPPILVCLEGVDRDNFSFAFISIVLKYLFLNYVCKI